MGLQELIAKHDETKKQLAEAVKNELIPTIQEFLRQTPEFTEVRWVQYTPYFNDGDSCVFSKGELEIGRSVDEDSDEFDQTSSEYDIPVPYAYQNRRENSYWDDVIKKYEAKLEEKGPAFKEVADRIQALHEYFSLIPDEILLDTFGDHVQVRVTIDSHEENQYEHD